MLYQNAIEQNYSHEQMTPLHSIISSSEKLLEQLKIIRDGTNLRNRKMASSSKRSHKKMQTLVDFFDEGRELTKNILYSSQIMHFYN
jgi:signal transduction histidine kinase